MRGVEGGQDWIEARGPDGAEFKEDEVVEGRALAAFPKLLGRTFGSEAGNMK